MKGENTWAVMIKSLETWACHDVLPFFDEMVIVLTKSEEGGNVLIEVGNDDKPPYSSVSYDWTGDGVAVVRHALDTTEANLVAKRGKQLKAPKKQKTAKRKKK